ncbi:hypothetical protein OG426_10200 [Streptomyces canus]|uniref:hypothetical protein n=1 Tax=Streptomyces canus TaxID=58343 RepID=UPI002256ECB3|nr:hypothetical protein [Streptomyces canus]MCX4862200.1 hypothetical protein [Streptomyces canus]WSW32808.1 hypothetical protein OG426_10200 [Streptomyces canus]
MRTRTGGFHCDLDDIASLVSADLDPALKLTCTLRSSSSMDHVVRIHTEMITGLRLLGSTRAE